MMIPHHTFFGNTVFGELAQGTFHPVCAGGGGGGGGSCPTNRISQCFVPALPKCLSQVLSRQQRSRRNTATQVCHVSVRKIDFVTWGDQDRCFNKGEVVSFIRARETHQKNLLGREGGKSGLCIALFPLLLLSTCICWSQWVAFS